MLGYIDYVQSHLINRQKTCLKRSKLKGIDKKVPFQKTINNNSTSLRFLAEKKVHRERIKNLLMIQLQRKMYSRTNRKKNKNI